jgi:hypothetical protein
MLRRTAATTAMLAVLGVFALAGCSSPASVTPPASNGGNEEVVEETVAEEPEAAAEGTRENPWPLGSTIEADDWTVVVNSVALGATDEIIAANQFNEPPVEGNEFILINYTVTYTGDDADGQMAAFVGVDYVTPDGVTIDSTDAIVVAPEPIDVTATLYNGGSITGNKALSVPSASAGEGVLAIRPGMIADTVFVAVQ